MDLIFMFERNEVEFPMYKTHTVTICLTLNCHENFQMSLYQIFLEQLFVSFIFNVTKVTILRLSHFVN